MKCSEFLPHQHDHHLCFNFYFGYRTENHNSPCTRHFWTSESSFVEPHVLHAEAESAGCQRSLPGGRTLESICPLLPMLSLDW